MALSSDTLKDLEGEYVKLQRDVERLEAQFEQADAARQEADGKLSDAKLRLRRVRSVLKDEGIEV